MNRRLFNAWMVLAVAFCFGACSSSGPATTYYVLDSSVSDSDVQVDPANVFVSVGVGPVNLPGYLENTAIVSRKNTQQLNVSGYHAWSEPLDHAISRLLSKALSSRLGSDDVWSFPWDSRNRPERQVSLIIEQLDGVRGESVLLRAKWFVFNSQKNDVETKGSYDAEIELNSSSYSDYVGGIADALINLSEKIAKSLSQ